MTVPKSLHYEKMLNVHGGRLKTSWELTGKHVKSMKALSVLTLYSRYHASTTLSL